MIILWIIILILSLSIIGLIIMMLLFLKKATYMSKKEKEFIAFAIEMYINYAEELDIHSPEQHELIVNELEKIKKRYEI